MEFYIAAVIGYAIGCINLSQIIPILVDGEDIRLIGNGRPDPFNIAVNINPWIALGIMLFDAAKTIGACLIATHLWPEVDGIGLMAASYAVIGDLCPAHMRFNGSCAAATYIGLMTCVSTDLAAKVMLAAILLTFVTNYTIFIIAPALIACPLYMLANDAMSPSTMLATVLAMFVTIRHIEHLRNMWQKTEPTLTEILFPKTHPRKR